jgi:hypothetical protein
MIQGKVFLSLKLVYDVTYCDNHNLTTPGACIIKT